MVDKLGLEAQIGVDTTVARNQLKALEAAVETLNKSFAAGNTNLKDYATGQATLARAISTAQSAIDRSLVASANVAQKSAQTQSIINRDARADALATENAIGKAEAAKQKAFAATAKAALQEGKRNATSTSNPTTTGSATVARNLSSSLGYDKEVQDELNTMGKFYRQLEAQDAQAQKVRQEQARKSNAQLVADEEASNKARIANNRLAAQDAFGLPDTGALNQTRYALYDVSTTLGVLGAALTAAGGSALYFGTQYETAFSGIQRTTQATLPQLAQIQSGLLDLSETIPVGFADLSGVATLGAQLNIANDDLVSFTDTTARFSAVTNVTLDAAATGFGSLATLLNVNASEFENLGSSVAYAGVKSVATESEILNMATSIGASATQAGFLADESIGLASALASLRIQPEQARGVILRLFNDFDKAVSQGGDKLANYAKVLGVSTDAAKKLWDTKPEQFFSQLLKGLSTAQDLNGALGQLGITETRETNVLQRLAGNYDVYTQSINNAKEAYSDGTFLTTAYGSIAEDVASKIKILVDSIQNVLAQAGSALLPIVGPALDIITKLVQGLRLIPAPILGLVAGFTLLAGGIALVGAGAAAFLATAFAMRTVLVGLQTQAPGVNGVFAQLRAILVANAEAFGVNTIAAKVNAFTLRDVGLAAKTAAIGLTSTVGGLRGATTAAVAETVAVDGAAVASKGFTAALLGIPFVNIIAAASILIPVILSVGQAIGEASAASLESGKALASAGGGIESFMQTLTNVGSKDSFGKLKVGASDAEKQLAKASDAAADTAKNVDILSGSNADATDKIGGSVGALDTQTRALSQNSKAWVLNAINKDSANNGLQDIANNEGQLKAFEKYGIDIGDAIEKGATKKGGVKAALETQLRAAGGKINPNDYVAVTDFQNLFSNVDKLGSSIDGLFSVAKVNGQISEAIGLPGATADSADAEANVSALSNAISELFSATDLEGSFLAAMDQLNQGLEDGGTAFETFSAAGRTNLDNLKGAFNALVPYAQSKGVDTADAIAQALYSINGKALDTSALLQQLAAVPAEFKADLDIKDVIAKYNSIAQLGVGGGITLTAQKGELARLKAQRASLAKQQATSSGGGGGSGSKSKKDQDTVKTLSEYVSDLGTAMKDAFSKQFGLPQAIDDVSAKFNTMAKNIQDAKDQVRDLNADLQQLAADRNKLQAQLFVANAYGDTVRADEIRAALAQNQNDTSDKSTALASATAQATAQLEGNSQAAIDNRAAILGLVSAYQDQISAYAATGASASQLAAYSAQLKGEFQAQLVQLGFNQGAVAQYATAFDSLTTAINAVPLNKTVTVDANTTGASSKINNLSGQVAALDAQIDALNGDIINSQAKLDKQKRAQAIQTELTGLQSQLFKNSLTPGAGGVLSNTASLQAQIAALQQKLNSGNYARGGVVGGSGKSVSKYQDDVSANLKIGEGVLTVAGLKAIGGADVLNAINQGNNPFGSPVMVTQGSAQTSGIQIVELTAGNLQFLADALQVRLQIGDQVITKAANSGTLTSAKRGNN